jgi:hypothetical protein
MDGKEERRVEPEHLVESHELTTAHEQHEDTLAEAVAHDKAQLDDRWASPVFTCRLLSLLRTCKRFGLRAAGLSAFGSKCALVAVYWSCFADWGNGTCK